jgi:acetylornithine deacetylase/succinyl-diaminopimelate desuccinylase-like protein
MGVDPVFEAVANILVVQYEFLALLLAPYRDLDQAHKPNENIRRAALESGTEKILKVVARLLQQ